MTVVEIVAALASLSLGYVFGSLPLPVLVGRMAGVDDARTAGDVWRRAGPGSGLLALAVDLARAILPVALALVTFSWIAGAAAGLGAVAGTLWPAAGRLPADRSVVPVLGVLLVLIPAAGLLGVIAAALVVVVRRPSARR